MYFSRTELNFWIWDKLSPVSNMVSSRSEENINLNYFTNWWCNSYGETCNFFWTILWWMHWQLLWPMFIDCMADVVANCVWYHVTSQMLLTGDQWCCCYHCWYGWCYCHVVMLLPLLEIFWLMLLPMLWLMLLPLLFCLGDVVPVVVPLIPVGEIVEVNIFLRPGRSHVGNWWKLVSNPKIKFCSWEIQLITH